MYFLTYWYLICMNICIYLLSIFNEPSSLTKGFQFFGSGVDQKPLASKDVNNPNHFEHIFTLFKKFPIVNCTECKRGGGHRI